MAKIKLVASDLDGTLLTSKKEITRRLNRTLEQIYNLGIYFVPTTGRAFHALPDYIRQLPSFRYVITSNGACVYDAMEKRVLFQNYLSPEAVDITLENIKGMDLILEVIHDGQGYVDKSVFEHIESYSLTESHIAYIRKTRIPVDNIFQEIEAHKASLEMLNLIFRDSALRKKTWDSLKTKANASITSYSEKNIEITSLQATKANALQQLCGMLEIDAENVLAMGDGDNDVDMLYWAGASVAVANAPQHVKNAANILTESCDEDGAAIVLDRVVAASILEQLLKRGEL